MYKLTVTKPSIFDFMPYTQTSYYFNKSLFTMDIEQINNKLVIKGDKTDDCLEIPLGENGAFEFEKIEA